MEAALVDPASDADSLSLCVLVNDEQRLDGMNRQYRSACVDLTLVDRETLDRPVGYDRNLN